jgi:lipopolysaccharide export system protein LptA
MRRTRWLILAAITIIVVAVASTYYSRLARLEKEAPARPQPLRAGLDATAEGWRFRKTDDVRRGPNGAPCPVIEVLAKSFEQIKEPSSYQLGGVELKIFHDCGETYDDVKSAKASFDTASGLLYSEGEVEITMGVAGNQPAAGGRLVKIVSSGVHFETQTGKVFTDKPAHFTFENGDGKAVGADYDPNNRQLHMKSEVVLNWRGRSPKAIPMKVESADLVYFEQPGMISLSPWARMTRGATKVQGAQTWVTLDGDKIQLVQSDNANGVQEDPNRKIEYSAAKLALSFSDEGQVNRVVGDQNANLVSTTATGTTNVRTNHLELSLNTAEKESTLEQATAMGNSVVESRPAVKPGIPPPDTRVLKSDFILLRMRPGGQEISSVETHTPGSLEFIPNRAGQPHRYLNGERFWIAYGAGNNIQSFRATKATTRTEKPPKDGKPAPPVLTSSDEFKAEFDPATNQVARLEQTSTFRYQEGDRKAQSDRATLDERTSNITLTSSARVVDASGSASADRIVLNQKSGDFSAEGHVTSTRLPDKKGSSSAMLSNSEPIQAKADRMNSTGDNRQIQYIGHAVAWQGANRIEADRIDIDRDKRVMRASGSVVSQFVDKPKTGKDGKPVAQQTTVFTVVRAPRMVYTEETRLAHYQGGAVLNRPNLTVKAREIKAYLKDANDNSDSSLDRAVADGSVVVVQTAPDRVKTGTSEHAEYFAADEKMVMTGGKPKFVDSQKGTTTGDELTYYARNDRLLVNGVENRRAESTILRK